MEVVRSVRAAAVLLVLFAAPGAVSAQWMPRAAITASAYRHSVEALVRADACRGPGCYELYEQAATILLNAVDASPANTSAPIALEQAARALRLAGRPRSAAIVYARVA